jgi:hypothetical protein
MTNLGHVYVLKSKYRDELNNLGKRKMNSTLLVIFRFIIAVQIVIFNNMNFWDL